MGDAHTRLCVEALTDRATAGAAGQPFLHSASFGPVVIHGPADDADNTGTAFTYAAAGHTERAALRGSVEERPGAKRSGVTKAGPPSHGGPAVPEELLSLVEKAGLGEDWASALHRADLSLDVLRDLAQRPDQLAVRLCHATPCDSGPRSPYSPHAQAALKEAMPATAVGARMRLVNAVSKLEPLGTHLQEMVSKVAGMEPTEILASVLSSSVSKHNKSAAQRRPAARRAWAALMRLARAGWHRFW